MAKRRGVDTRIARLLLQVSLMCSRFRRFKEAEYIIRAVKAFRDDIPAPGTALAFTFFSQDRLRDAMLELESVLSKYPQNQMSKALLGLIRREAGELGWQRLLNEVIEDGRDEIAIKLAQESLGVSPGKFLPRTDDGADAAPASLVYVRG